MATALQRQKALQAKEQVKRAELEEPARNAKKAVDEAKEKAIKRQEEINQLQTNYEWEKARSVPTPESVANLHKALRDTFQAFPAHGEAKTLITQLDAAVTGLSGLLAAATPTPPATDCSNDVDMAVLANEAYTRAFFWLLGDEEADLTDQEREAKKQNFQALFANTTHCACSRPAALSKGPSLTSLATVLVREAGPSPNETPPDSAPPQKASWTITTANVTAWKSGQLMMPGRNIGADLQLGKRRRAQVVKRRMARAGRRTTRARPLRKAGAHTRNLTICGSNAGVLWGSEALSFTPAQLRAIRSDAAKATFRLSRGQHAAVTMLANAQKTGAKSIDPAFRHHRQVILAWATGVWEGVPDLDTMQAALRGAIARLSGLKRPWCCATDAAATFVLTLLRLGWSAQSARHLTTHDGTKIDLLGVAPQTVGFWVDQATLVWTDSSGHWGKSKGQLSSGRQSDPCWPLGNWKDVPSGTATCWSRWSLEAFGRRTGFPDFEAGTTTIASSVAKTLAPCFTAATSARPCRWSGTCVSRRNCGRRFFFTRAAIQGTVCTRRFPLPLTNLASRLRQHSCPVLWHNRPPEKLLEGHILTDGSSSGSAAGSGALRRAGWAVVDVDDLGNLKSAAHGAVPVDVLPEQNSRDGEDYAAAMAGPITMDPLTLHINCAGTIATEGQGSGSQREKGSRLEQAALLPRRGQGCQSQGPRDGGRRAGWALHPFVPTWKQFRGCVRREKVQTYTSHPFESRALCWASLPWPSKLPAGRPLGRHGGQAERQGQGTRAKRTQSEALAMPATGQASDWLSPTTPSPFSQDSQLDPLSFTGHSLQLGRLFNQGSRALDSPIVFCTICGPVYWERADALCHQSQRGCRLRTAEGERRGCGQLQLPGVRWRIAEGYVQGRRLHKFRSATWGWKQYARWGCDTEQPDMVCQCMGVTLTTWPEWRQFTFWGLF